MSDMEQAAAALGRIPSGLGVLTATHQGRSTAMLASWIQQASFEPLMVTVCVKHDRPIQSLIEGSGRFLLNIVGKDQGQMLKRFSKGYAPDEDAFAGLAITERPTGVELNDAIAHLGCNVASSVDAGDHRVYVGEVIAGDGDPAAEPLVHVRKSARTY